MKRFETFENYCHDLINDKDVNVSGAGKMLLSIHENILKTKEKEGAVYFSLVLRDMNLNPAWQSVYESHYKYWESLK